MEGSAADSGGRLKTGPFNRITDIEGLRVGNAEDPVVRTGVSVLLADRPMIAAVDVRGGGPGTRETDALALAGSVDEVHAIVLSGGSAFGLSAASAVQAALAADGIGFAVGPARVPIVPQAILFDLLNGGAKNWGAEDPYHRLGSAAYRAAIRDFSLGSRGAGFGATTAMLRGGLGSASALLRDGTTIGALVAVNALGSATVGSSQHFWAAPFEIGDEYGGLGSLLPPPEDALDVRLKGGRAENTTLAIVATDARLDKRQCQRLAVMAQDGLARAIYPVHTPLDGDVVFAVSAGDRALRDPFVELAHIGAIAANVLTRAVARAVFLAAPSPDEAMPPSYRERFPLDD